MSTVDTSYSYRNQTSGTSTSTDTSTSKTGNVYDAVFSDGSDNKLKVDDFLQLMVEQLKNQDFMNPVDDTQYLSQLAQFSTMQQMQELAAYSKSNYAMSLVGKDVTVASISVTGALDKQTGPVQKVSLVDNEYRIYVNGKSYTLDQIMEVNGVSSSGSADGDVDPSDKAITATVNGTDITLKWPAASSSANVAEKLKYTVYYSTNSNMSSVSEVESNGTRLGEADRTNLTSETIKGLNPDTTYFINVVVTDSSGKKYVYQKATIHTDAEAKG